MTKKRLFLSISSLILILFSCCQQEIKFDKEKWNIQEDIFYKYREIMVDDLMNNHLKKGMTYQEVISLLGEPNSRSNDSSNTICYEIMVDYGFNIDPQKGEDLYIEFSIDSTLISAKIVKWNH